MNFLDLFRAQNDSLMDINKFRFWPNLCLCACDSCLKRTPIKAFWLIFGGTFFKPQCLK